MSAALVTAWAALAAGFTFVALVRLAWRRPLTSGARRPARGVVLLRPVDAPTDSELANLGQTVEGVEQVVVSPRPWGTGRHLPSDPATGNRKLGHLKHALACLAAPEPHHATRCPVADDAQPQAVLVADADVAVDDALVDGLLAAIEAGAHLAWAAPRPTGQGLARGLLVQSMQSFEVLGAMSIGPPSVCGKAMALGPEAAEALAALPDCIGEDLELARTLHERGLKVVQAGHAATPGSQHRASTPRAAWGSWPPLRNVGTSLFDRFTRWMQVLKAHRPGLFPSVPLLLACTPVLLVAAVFTGAGAAVAALVALRLAAAAMLERRPGLYLAWLGGEALLLACWARALVAGRSITWRGRSLRVGAHGVLE